MIRFPGLGIIRSISHIGQHFAGSAARIVFGFHPAIRTTIANKHDRVDDLKNVVEWLRWAVIAVLLAAIATAAYIGYSGSSAIWLLSEDGPLEWTHAALCLLASFLFFSSSAYARDALKAAGLLLGLFTLLATLREADFNVLNSVLAPPALGATTVRRIMYGMIGVGLIVIALRYWRLLPQLIGMAASRESFMLYAAATCYFISWRIDRLAHNTDMLLRLAEETTETFGHAALVMAALHHWRLVLKDAA